MRRTEKGFSATELLVVMAIIGVIGMIATANLSRYKLNLTSANQDLESDIRTARANAFGRNVHFRVTLSANSYQIARLKLIGSTWSIDTSRTVDLPTTISVTVGVGQAIEFTTRGMLIDKPDGRIADPISVTLRDSKSGDTKQITIWPSGQLVEA